MVLLLAYELWNMDVNEVEKDGTMGGNGYPIENSSTINGELGCCTYARKMTGFQAIVQQKVQDCSFLE